MSGIKIEPKDLPLDYSFHALFIDGDDGGLSFGLTLFVHVNSYFDCILNYTARGGQYWTNVVIAWSRYSRWPSVSLA